MFREAVRRIVEVARRLRKALLGSAARGEMTEDSDPDVLVVCRAPADRLRMVQRLEGIMAGFGLLFDVPVFAEECLARTRDDPGYIYGTALREGRENSAANDGASSQLPAPA